MSYKSTQPTNKSDLNEFARYINNERFILESAINSPESEFYEYTELNVAPTKPRNGRQYYADGTNWNPGSGRGMYFYNGSTYKFLG